MKIRLCYFFMCFNLLAASAALAEVYRYVDENGQVHFTDKKTVHGDSVDKAEKVELKIKPLTAEQEQAAAEKVQQLKAQQQKRREVSGSARGSTYGAANRESQRNNCNYYKQQLAKARQRMKSVKLNGYTVDQKAYATEKIRNAQASVRNYCG